jgi:quercetin dioxygenase-like cupin family protein
MVHQGALVFSENAAKIKSEKIVNGNFTDIIHLHLKKDSILEEHISKSNATIIVIDGEIDFIMNGHRYKLEKGDYLNFEANVLHALEAFEETHIILIK